METAIIILVFAVLGIAGLLWVKSKSQQSSKKGKDGGGGSGDFPNWDKDKIK